MIADWQRVASKVIAIWTQKFETELPPKLDGAPAQKIAEANRKAIDEAKALMQLDSSYE
jgi:hypothetical protein